MGGVSKCHWCDFRLSLRSPVPTCGCPTRNSSQPSATEKVEEDFRLASGLLSLGASKLRPVAPPACQHYIESSNSFSGTRVLIVFQVWLELETYAECESLVVFCVVFSDCGKNFF